MRVAALEERYGLSSSTKKIYALYESHGDLDNATHSLRHVRSQ